MSTFGQQLIVTDREAEQNQLVRHLSLQCRKLSGIRLSLDDNR